ncbi:MAG TPA: type II secretion system F family protein [Candidatus Thermoplasmatota archaeon]|nr:type II secretion system F family protein [Candidatus Thermoplasmatota archaeon]
MTLSPLERAAYRLLGAGARRQLARDPSLAAALAKAHSPRAPEVYLAYVHLLALLAALEGLVALLVVAVLLPLLAVEVPLLLSVLALAAPALLPGVVLGIGYAWPRILAGERAAKTDIALPGALNYMAVMANSGMTPDRMVASLSRQPIYDEAADEARWIATEVRWLGKDLTTALSDAVPRTASARLADVWQGMRATIQSGADLRTYLLSKAEQMHRDMASLQRRNLESLGVLAESFLVVAVAAPIFLIIMLTVMGSSGPSQQSTFLVFWLLILVMIPLTQAFFALAVRSLRGRVW